MRITWEILMSWLFRILTFFWEFDQNFLRIFVKISDENLIFFEKKIAIIFFENFWSEFSWEWDQKIFQLLFPFSFFLLGIPEQRNAAKKQKQKWLGVLGLVILMSCCCCKNKIILLNHKLTIRIYNLLRLNINYGNHKKHQTNRTFYVSNLFLFYFWSKPCSFKSIWKTILPTTSCWMNANHIKQLLQRKWNGC